MTQRSYQEQEESPYSSIFSSQARAHEKHFSAPAYSHPPQASTINNIVINNFNNTNVGQTPASFFPPLNSVVKPQPSIEQAAELAHVTQLAGGVKPLHQKG